jgi:hypothetical protein
VTCQMLFGLSEQFVFRHTVYISVITLNSGYNLQSVERKLQLEYVWVMLALWVFHRFVVLRQLKGVGQTSYNSFQNSLEAILYRKLWSADKNYIAEESCKWNKCNSKLLETFKNQFFKFLEIEEAMRQNELCFISQK